MDSGLRRNDGRAYGRRRRSGGGRDTGSMERRRGRLDHGLSPGPTLLWLLVTNLRVFTKY